MGANCLFGTCANIQNPCTTDADCVIQCTMSDNGTGDSVGVCETKAKACGKGEGMTCNELETQQADCHDY